MAENANTQNLQQPPAPDPKLRRLDPLVGWLEGGYFLVQTEEGNQYEGKVTDGKLTFTGPARFQYELDADGKIEANPDGTITVVWRLRDRDGNWKPWMNNTFTKIEEDV